MPDRYDAFPYTGHVYRQTHPDRLALIARLFGMSPAPPERCRVLELACGEGANLLPLAEAFPDSTYLGVDLSQAAIIRAVALTERSNLTNLEFRREDVTQFPEDAGEFDYIIAHGLYSWVPPHVRESILQLCARHLAPQGVVYISYNAYPGGYMRQMFRSMMHFHSREAATPEEEVRESRALLQFLQATVPEKMGFAEYFRGEAGEITRHDDCFLYHDLLAENNQPFYMHEFLAAAARHNLKYLCEAEYHETQPSNASAAARAHLSQIDDRITREQYIDFARNRTFRQTLLCHAKVSLRDDIDENAIRSAHCSAEVRASHEPDLRNDEPVEFSAVLPTGKVWLTAPVHHPLSKAVLTALAGVAPGWISFDQLLADCRARLHAAGSSTQCDAAMLQDAIAALYSTGLVELHAAASLPFTREPGECPRTTLLARVQALEGCSISNRAFLPIRIPDRFSRELMALLDGTRDRRALLGAAAQFETKPEADLTLENLEEMLRTAAGLALLVD